MLTLQQQKDEIDEEVRIKKIEAENIAAQGRQDAVDEESRKIKEKADYDISQIQKNAQI